MSSLKLCINPQLEPERRYLAALAAQCSGVFVLFVTAGIFDIGNITHQPDIENGIQWMVIIAILAVVALVVGAVIPFMSRDISSGFQQEKIDKMVAIYLIADILLTTMLVCQQGGLTRSVLFPFFFLIPVAHRLVERGANEKWILRSHGALAAAMIGTLLIPLLLISRGWVSVNDFSDLTNLKKSYAFAILLMSLASLWTPVLMEFIKCKWPDGDKARASKSTAQGQQDTPTNADGKTSEEDPAHDPAA